MRMQLTLGALVLVASTAAAQSVPPITRTRQAATNAVAKANARTTASSTLAESPEPARAQPRSASSAAATRGVSTDSAAGSTAVVGARTPPFERESFRYSRSGRRDPFVSLMTTGDLRPLITDLELVAVAWDPTGQNSVAVLHDISTKDKEQYRVRVGQSLGRMRVASIAKKAVVFTIEEFGYSRQETLGLRDSNKERKQ